MPPPTTDTTCRSIQCASRLLFDSYSTLVDVDAARRALAERVADPEPVSKLRCMRSLEYETVANHISAYRPFYEMNRDALRCALDATGADVSVGKRDGTLVVYHELDVFDDFAAALGVRLSGQTPSSVPSPRQVGFDNRRMWKAGATGVR